MTALKTSQVLMDRRKIFIILFFLFLFPSISSARYITMDTTVQTTLKPVSDTDEKETMLTVSVELVNNGDEPAYDVMLNVEIGPHSQVGNARRILNVKDPLREIFDFGLSFEKPGTYPLVVRTDFADANQHPFSSLSLSLIKYKEAVASKIFFGNPESLEIAKKGDLHLKMKSLDHKERDVMVRLILPRELNTSEPVRKISIGPRQTREMSFAISNFSALVGSNLPVFALLAYDKEETHCSVSVMNTVKIIEKEKLSQKAKFVILGIPVGLLALFVVIAGIRRLRRSSSP